MRDPKVILITGASSGIGEALALAYAAPGRTLALTGRDATRLDKVAGRCRERGATVRRELIDVTERERLAERLLAIDAETPIELAIANAGISGGTGGAPESDGQARRIFAVDLDGVLNTLLPLVEPMRARRRGQLAVMSSLAAFRGFPGAPAYCAAKAAVRVWGEGMRGVLAEDGVEATVICPGFVRSPMTAVNPYRMPLLMDADRAAGIIRRGLERNRGRIAFPLPTYLGALLAASLPSALADRLLRRTPRKGALDAAGGNHRA